MHPLLKLSLFPLLIAGLIGLDAGFGKKARQKEASQSAKITQDHAAAAIATTGTPVFAWKGETLKDYWECTQHALDFPNNQGPTLIVDDGGDATLMIHKGIEIEQHPNLLQQIRQRVVYLRRSCQHRRRRLLLVQRSR